MRNLHWRIALIFVLGGAMAPAQQLLNGGFEDGGAYWTNSVNGGDYNFSDADGDGDLEAVFPATNLMAQDDNAIIVQDFSPDYIDLNYGLALSADICASNLNNDIRAFTKLEFLDEFGGFLVSAEDGATNTDSYATGDQCHRQATLVKQHRSLVQELDLAGKTIDDVKKVRATVFLYRLGAGVDPSTGLGYFDNVSFGLVSRAYDAPGIVNGGFEYDDWWWRESFVSSGSGWHCDDLDGDGDKELQLDADGLTNQFEGRLWIQEFDARLIDFSQGVRLTADVGATNLSPQFKVFTKLEFFTNAPPYSTNEIYYALPPPVSLDGATNAAFFATNNQTILGLTLDKSYDALTNELAQIGSEVGAITTLRTVLFLFSFEASNVTSGSGWFDNVKLDFKYKNAPNATSAAKTEGDNSVLSWSSQAGSTYRVQRLHDIYDFKWTNIAAGISGQSGTTSVTNDLAGDSGYLRVVRDP